MQNDCIYIIVEGSVELSSRYSEPRLLGAGQVFGELNLIRRDPSMTVLTKSEVHLKKIRTDAFLESIGNEPLLATVVLESLFSRCRGMNERLQELESKTTHNLILQMNAKRSPKRGVVLRGISSRAKDVLNHRELVMDQFPFRFCRKPDNPGPLASMGNYLLLHDDPPFEISQHHCQLIRKEQKIVLSDSTSRFGTLVDGTAIGRKFSRQEYELSPGTHQIHLGLSSRALYAFEIEIG